MVMMRLLVSVADGRGRFRCAGGGADVIDAKDPRRGALGAVSRGLLEIHGAIAACAPRLGGAR